MSGIVVAVIAFVVMEPTTYAAHRWVMHGPGARLHRSHHRRWPRRPESEPWVEGNDLFPVAFGALTVAALAAGFNVDRLTVLVPVAVGVTAYGAAYAAVHDVYVHRRIALRWSRPALDRLAEAHELHHRFGGEPYGMLLPVVPVAVRRRAAASAVRSPDPAPNPGRPQVQRPPASTPRRHSVVVSTVRSRNDPLASSSAKRWSRSP